jgi:hypothetical protein
MNAGRVGRLEKGWKGWKDSKHEMCTKLFRYWEMKQRALELYDDVNLFGSSKQLNP